MQRLPLFHNLQQQPCLVVGGGVIAWRKVKLLLQCEAIVTVVAPDICPQLEAWHKSHSVELCRRSFSAQDVQARRLVVAATNIKEVNQQVVRACSMNNVLVNVVDDADLSSAIMGAIVDRSPVQVAISSNGAAPVLTRMLRRDLEQFLPARLGQLASMAEGFRTRIKAKFESVHERRRFWEQVLEGPIGQTALRGNLAEAEQALEQEVSKPTHNGLRLGEVYLVGAGPGDPELLTLRALRLMQQADVVLYDRLVSEQIMNLVRTEAELIYVGKRRAEHTLAQQSINQLLVQHAQAGRRVLRLKGGDPFIFGRGGEEIESLRSEKIRFEVVPGVTAASGCAAYAGIPLTHRDYSQSVVFVTGHLKNNQINLDFEGLVKPNQTLVVYMGLVGLAQLCQGLLQQGMAASTPIALVEQGTTDQQQVLISTVAEMPAKANATQLRGPTILIIGEVVRLHETLSWFHPSRNSN